MRSALGEHSSNSVRNYQPPCPMPDCWISVSGNDEPHWDIHGVSCVWHSRETFWQKSLSELFIRYTYILRHNRMGTTSSTCSRNHEMQHLLKDCHTGLDRAMEIFKVHPIFYCLEKTLTIPRSCLQCSMTSPIWRRPRSSCTKNCLKWSKHFLMPVQTRISHHQYVHRAHPSCMNNPETGLFTCKWIKKIGKGPVGWSLTPSHTLSKFNFIFAAALQAQNLLWPWIRIAPNLGNAQPAVT
jgi:hypothetical protein